MVSYAVGTVEQDAAAWQEIVSWETASLKPLRHHQYLASLSKSEFERIEQ